MFLSCTKCTIITVFSHLVGTSPLECNIFRLFSDELKLSFYNFLLLKIGEHFYLAFGFPQRRYEDNEP